MADDKLEVEARLLDFISKDIDGIKKKLGEFKKKVDDVAKSGKKLNSFKKSFANMKNGIANVLKQFGPAALVIGGVTAAISGLTNATKAVVNISKQFQASMSRLKAITRPTADEFSALAAKARELGASTSFSATQAGDAFVELGKLGFEANQIIAASASVLNLAALSQVSMAESAKVTAETLKQFGLYAEESTRVVDVMSKAFNISALDISKFSESMKFVGPIAGQTNVSLEKTTSFLATLANQGIAGSQAGTGLRFMMSQLAQTGSKVSNVLRKSGSSATEFNEKLEDLKKLGLTTGEIMELFGERGGLVASILMSSGDATSHFNTELEKAAGTAKEMSDIILDDLEGDLKIFKSTNEELALSIGDFILPALRATVKAATKVSFALSEAVKGMGVNTKAIKTNGKELDSIIAKRKEYTKRVEEWRKAIKNANGDYVSSPILRGNRRGRQTTIEAANRQIAQLASLMRKLSGDAEEAGKTLNKALGLGKAGEASKALEKIKEDLTDITGGGDGDGGKEKEKESVIAKHGQGSNMLLSEIQKTAKASVAPEQGAESPSNARVSNVRAMIETIQAMEADFSSSKLLESQLLQEQLAEIESSGFSLRTETLAAAEEEVKTLQRQETIDQWAERLQVAQQFASQISNIASSISQTQMNLIEKERRADVTKAEASIKNEKKRAEAIKGINKKAEDEKKKAAKKEKAMALVMSAINTAQAITGALSMKPTPLGVAMAILVGAAGTAQMASIASQQFAMGTDSAPGGTALVGERGPELVNLPRGSQVFTAGETRAIQNSTTTNTTNESGGNTLNFAINDPASGEMLRDALRSGELDNLVSDLKDAIILA